MKKPLCIASYSRMRILIAIPAYNEEKIIEPNLKIVYAWCLANLKGHEWKIVVADNNSKDATAQKITNLIKLYPNISYLFVSQKGKGGAIRAAWEKYDADIYIFMDADLSTDLTTLPELIASIYRGCDIAYGSRIHKDSQVSRTFFRKCVSFFYRLVLKIILCTKIQDAPCGFKAINNRIKKEVLPRVKNNEWFFDSELLILSEKLGYRTCAAPVVWRDKKEERQSHVKIFSLAREYLREVWRLKREIPSL